MIRLFFQGELSVVWTTTLAFVVAVAVAWYYSRETRVLAMPHRWLLPFLRALAIFLVIFMLAGPMMEFRRERGKIATVNVFIDATDSMKFTDPSQVVGSPNSPDLASDSDTEQSLSSSDAMVDNGPTRMVRAVKLILGSGLEKGWLDSVKATHRVKLYLVGGDASEPIYDSLSPDPPPKSIDIDQSKLDRSTTDLSSPIGNRVLAAIDSSVKSTGGDAAAIENPKSDQSNAGKPGTGAEVVVILSDGQHNAGRSPEELAKQMGDLAVPVFTIAFGQRVEPIDLAILDIDAPPLVASTGRAAGTLSIKDLGNVGDKYRVRITSGSEIIWENVLTTENQVSRRVPFDFSVAALVAKQKTNDNTALDRSRVVIPLQVTVETVTGEHDLANNTMEYRLSASTRTRKMLIVDSRSRWETRYIRNVFERDPTWNVETIILWPDRSSLAALDEVQPEFPNDQKELSAFDIIVWGDVDRQALTGDQLLLVRDFVARGGGLVLIDGDRNHLSELTGSVLEDLIPIRSLSQRIEQPMKLTLTAVGAERAAMVLLPGSVTPEENERTWNELQAPTSIKDVEVLPGAEVWLESRVDGATKTAPVLVSRLFGGGQVVYMATDQTWRWRYRVADLYHARFWNQLVEAIMQPPFDVRDQYIALSTGPAQYRAGERATIRAQLRDASSSPVTDAVVDVVLKVDGVQREVVPLRLVDEARGIYQGESSPMDSGNFEATVRSSGYTSSSAVVSTFLVSPPPNRENFRLSQNSELLSAMAAASGGIYVDEADAKKVWDAIQPLSDGKIETTKLAMAQSFIWFFLLIGILAMEWWLRKKVGLV